MKKLISFLSSVAILASCGVSSFVANAEEATTSNTVVGDVNADGVIDINDGIKIEKTYILLMQKRASKDSISETDFALMDTNYDETINSSDAVNVYIYAKAKSFGYADEDGIQKDEMSKINAFEKANPYDTEKLKAYNDNWDISYDKAKAEMYAEIAKEYPVTTKEDVKYYDMNNDNCFDETDGEIYNKYLPTDINGDGRIDYKDLDGIVNIQKGDANGDFKVDCKDAVVTLKNYASALVNNSSTESSIDFSDYNADFNSDGEINSKDAVLILKTYLFE